MSFKCSYVDFATGQIVLILVLSLKISKLKRPAFLVDFGVALENKTFQVASLPRVI